MPTFPAVLLFRRRVLLPGLLAAVAVGLSHPLWSDAPRRDPQENADLEFAARLEGVFASVAERVRPTVVAVAATDQRSADSSSADEDSAWESFGSGFIIDHRGYVLTNEHLVGDARSIRVRLSDGRESLATLVQADASSDIALLKIDLPDLHEARLGDSSCLRVGQWVLAIGNPFGLLHTVSAGIVSALKRTDLQLLPYEDFIQTDATINPGNSGGPLINLRGEVVGINTAIYSAAGQGNRGISFAVPIDLAHALAERWIEGKGISYLGVALQRVDKDMAAYYGLDEVRGAFVRNVSEESPAMEAGLRAMDVIVNFAGQRVADDKQLQVLIAKQATDVDVPITVLRSREAVQMTATLRLRTDLSPRPDSSAHRRVRQRRLFGVTLTTLTERLREQLSVADDVTGVAIVAVESQSVAARKGLQTGDVIVSVNGKAVKDLRDVRSALSKDSKTVAFEANRGMQRLGFFFLPR